MTGCATTPRFGAVRQDDFAALSAGAQIYFSADLAALRPVLDALPPDALPAGAGTMTGYARTAAVALYIPAAERNFLVFARGDFPAWRAGLSLAWDPAWRRRTDADGRAYWRSRDGWSLALDAGSALVADGPFPADGQAPEPPIELGRGLNGAALAGWADDPGPWLRNALGAAGAALELAIDRVVFSLRADPATLGAVPAFAYEIMLDLPAARSAKAVAAMLRLAKLLPPTGDDPWRALLSTCTVEARDARLIIAGGGLDPSAIALLYGRLSVYFAQ
jgi:hypothetical protein